ncbi:site-specific integrase [Pseudopedobacter beijingensis]|uniref:Site-specific integrase n=1 Tax=Pseudopedobacter beijingensis TaxID=1207056 RepID=A0ABW4IA91_9SPHI
MVTLSIVLNTTKKTVKEEYPVCLRITYERKSKYVAVNTIIKHSFYKFKCKKSEWKSATIEDGGFGRFAKSKEDFDILNDLLLDALNRAKKLAKDYQRKDIDFTFDMFINELTENKNDKKIKINLLSAFYTKVIDDLEQQNKIGLATIFEDTRNQLLKFKPNAKIVDVNLKFLETFENYLRYERKNKDTTISVKIRNLQRLLNIAIEEGLFKRDNYPFGEKKYSVNRRLNHKTKKRSVPINVISKIKNLELEKGSALDLARDIFMFSFYTRGMNFIDIIGLTKNSIIDNEIYYIRSKTKQPFYIPINEYISAIIKKYGVNGDYLFPIYNDKIHVTLKQKYTRKKTALKKVNADLKEIAKLIGEPNINLTTYVSRHSYATNLKHAGVATSYISEALGHQTEEQTRTYLDEFEKGVISEFEKKIFDI